MMNLSKKLITLVSVFVFVSASAVEASQGHSLAYLDPGTGTIIFQVLIAGLVSAGFAIKLFWHSIKAFFLKLIGKEVACEEQPQETTSKLSTGKEDDE